MTEYFAQDPGSQMDIKLTTAPLVNLGNNLGRAGGQIYIFISHDRLQPTSVFQCNTAT